MFEQEISCIEGINKLKKNTTQCDLTLNDGWNSNFLLYENDFNFKIRNVSYIHKF